MKNWVWAAMLLMLSSGTLAAQDARSEATRFADLSYSVESELAQQIPTEHFAARSAYRDFAMSPDGSHLAIKRVVDGSTDLLLLDAATLQPIKIFRIGKEQRLDWFIWAGNEKLITSISMLGQYYDYPVRINRMFVRNIVSNEMWMLDIPDQLLWGGEIIHVDEDGDFALVSVQNSLRGDPLVYRYELTPDGEREKVVNSRGGVTDWYADETGIVRLGLGWQNNRLRVYYRPDADSNWDLVESIRPGDERSSLWTVSRIVAGSDVGYVLEENELGHVAVRRFDFSTGEPLETYFDAPNADVTEFWLDRTGSPLAALYTDDRDRYHWFDAEMGSLYDELREAIGLEDMRIVSRSRDNKRMLVWAGSEADPGALYVFSKDDLRLDLLGNYRPEVDFQQLVSPMPVRYRARDGLVIAAYLTLPRGIEPKGLPLIVMPHGGPFGIRDKLAYNDEVQLLANRGYAVLQPNYRGSGGYGEAFEEAGHGQVGRGMQDDIDDAMDWAVGEGIADPARVCVVGGSYGGFSALWAVIRNPERYRCAASWAGVTDWDRMMSYDRRYLGRARARNLRQREEGEDADLDAYSPINHAAELTRPILLAHGGEDRRVPASQYYSFERASQEAPVRPVTLLIEEEGHSFSKAENEQKWYDALVAFLAEHNPPDAPVSGSAASE